MTVPRKEVLQRMREESVGGEAEASEMIPSERPGVGEIVESIEIFRVFYSEDEPLGLIIRASEDVERVISTLALAQIKAGLNGIDDIDEAMENFADSLSNTESEVGGEKEDGDEEDDGGETSNI